jgi:hypothetical protein
MSQLRELQRRFAAALFDEEPGVAATLVHAGAIGAAQRIGIYRNNLREAFRKALALEFPVIERLVGADYFARLARDFHAVHPSRHGDLHHIGAPFPDFLRERFSSTEYAYFADVAALEWAHSEVLVAPDIAPLDPESLAEIPPDLYGDLRFTISPACRLVASVYPIVRIWTVNQPQSADEAAIDLSSGEDRVLVRRGRENIEFHRLDAPTFEFLAGLAGRQTLSVAFDRAERVDASFDLGAALQRMVALGVLVALDCATPADSRCNELPRELT